VPFHPVKTWRFAILPPIEVLVEMAYGSGMKNQAITVECLPLEVKNEGGSRLGNHLETSGGLKVVIKCRNRSYP
jgi:hypothetical protein